MLVLPPEVDVRHISVPKVTVADRLTHLRTAAAARVVQLRRGGRRRRPRDRRGDAVLAARALQAGRADLVQDEPFGEIQVSRARAAGPSIGRAQRVHRQRRGLTERRSRMSVALDGDTRGAAVPLARAGHRRTRSRRRPRLSPRPRPRRSRSSGDRLEPDGRGLVLRELAGGWTLASHPEAEEAARRLLARPRTPPLTPAQAETLAIIAYLQPVSRPEIARIRGVNAESAAATLLERGLVEESGRSQFGAVLYRTTDLFLRLFGLRSSSELPPISAFDPVAGARGGAARAAAARRRGPASPIEAAGAVSCPRRRRDRAASLLSAPAASWPQAAAMSRPRVSRTVAPTPVALELGPESLDRLGRRSLHAHVGRVVGDQVDLVDLRVEDRRELARLADAVVDAGRASRTRRTPSVRLRS